MQTRKQAPTTVAKLDLSDENQRRMQAFIQRSHEGRWPLWGLLGMRQIGQYIYEAAQWQPRNGQAATFCLLRFEPAACAVTWQDQPSRAATLSALAAAR